MAISNVNALSFNFSLKKSLGECNFFLQKFLQCQDHEAKFEELVVLVTSKELVACPMIMPSLQPTILQKMS